MLSPVTKAHRYEDEVTVMGALTFESGSVSVMPMGALTLAQDTDDKNTLP